MPMARGKGVDLAYDLVGEGPPLVLLHGGQTDRSIYRRILPGLSARFRVLNHDQRGVGKSDKPDVPYSSGLIADDTAALMDSLGMDQAIIVGTSFGGMVAQHFAIRHPHKAQAVVMGCAVTGGPHPVVLPSKESQTAFSTEELGPKDRARALAASIVTEQWLEAHPEIIDELIRDREANPIHPVGYKRRIDAAFSHDAYDRLPEIKCPTLVIAGRNDTIIDWKNSEIIAARIPGAKLVVIEQAGHGFWIEHPERTIEEIVNFLAEAGVIASE